MLGCNFREDQLSFQRYVNLMKLLGLQDLPVGKLLSLEQSSWILAIHWRDQAATNLERQKPLQESELQGPCQVL
jgi:hypothetical protein